MTKVKNKVGIVIRTKNRTIFLDRAIASINAQTFFDWHAYVVNDGGNKEELENALAKYGKDILAKLTLVNLPISAGRGGALSLGISVVSEEYVLIHDDDDSLEPQFLEKTVAYLDNDKEKIFSGVTVSNYDVFEYVEGEKIIVREKTNAMGLKSGTMVDFSLYLSYIGTVLPITLLFRKEIINRSGSVNVNMNYMEDYDLIVRIMHCGEIGIIEEFLSCYHHRDATGTSYDASRHEKPFDYRIAYKNSVIREAINNKSGLRNVQASFMHGKTMEEYHMNQLTAQVNALSQGFSSMCGLLSQILSKQ